MALVYTTRLRFASTSMRAKMMHVMGHGISFRYVELMRVLRCASSLVHLRI